MPVLTRWLRGLAPLRSPLSRKPLGGWELCRRGWLARQPAALILLGTVVVAACTRPPSCPKHIDTKVGLDNGHGGVQFAAIQFGGNEKPYLVGEILRVATECIPVELEKQKRVAAHSSILACTAWLTYNVPDEIEYKKAMSWPVRGHPSAVVRFEAVTSAGVVLGSATGSFTFVLNGRGGTVSAKIGGLSSEEVGRVAAVRALWEY